MIFWETLDAPAPLKGYDFVGRCVITNSTYNYVKEARKFSAMDWEYFLSFVLNPLLFHARILMEGLQLPHKIYSFSRQALNVQKGDMETVLVETKAVTAAYVLQDAVVSQGDGYTVRKRDWQRMKEKLRAAVDKF